MLPRVNFFIFILQGPGRALLQLLKSVRDFLAQINTGRGCESGPLWLDVNRAYVDVSCGYMKTQTSSFSRVNLFTASHPRAARKELSGRFPCSQEKKFCLVIFCVFWVHLQRCLLKTEMLLLKLHPAAPSRLYFRLTTKLCWLKNNFVHISQGRRLSQHCWCAGFHLISESLKEHLIFWEVRRPAPNVHVRSQQLVRSIGRKKSASGQTVFTFGLRIISFNSISALP